jgi:hypothetical protein
MGKGQIEHRNKNDRFRRGQKPIKKNISKKEADK